MTSRAPSIETPATRPDERAVRKKWVRPVLRTVSIKDLTHGPGVQRSDGPNNGKS